MWNSQNWGPWPPQSGSVCHKSCCCWCFQISFPLKPWLGRRKDWNILYLVLNWFFSVLPNCSQLYRANSLCKGVGFQFSSLTPHCHIDDFLPSELLVPTGGIDLFCTAGMGGLGMLSPWKIWAQWNALLAHLEVSLMHISCRVTKPNSPECKTKVWIVLWPCSSAGKKSPAHWGWVPHAVHGTFWNVLFTHWAFWAVEVTHEHKSQYV